MPRFTRNQKRAGWWSAIALLVAMAVMLGAGRLWALPAAAWLAYELCYCPTTCSVQTKRGGTCRNWAEGRLYACTNVAAHRDLKTDAILRMLGFRSRKRVSTPARRRRRRDPDFSPALAVATAVESPETDEDWASITLFQRVMLTLTLIGTACAITQTLAAAL